MLNLVSIIIGLVSLVFVAIAFLPLLGWANWLVVPLAVMIALGSGFAFFLIETQIQSRAVRVRNALLEHKAEEQS